jgi:hypothetical protein
MDLCAKGKTYHEALANLIARREAARKQLLNLGVAREAIQFSELTLVVPPIAADMPVPRPVVLSMVLKSEWPLRAGSVEEWLAFASDMQDKVRAANLGGNEPDKAAPTTAVSAPELDAALPAKPCNCGCKSSEPLFLFVYKVSEEDESRLRREAFRNAQRAAAKLAHAAQTELAGLHQISEEAAPTTEGTLPLLPGLPRAVSDGEMSSAEGVGLLGTKVTVRVTLNATFHLKGTGAK